MQQELTAVTVRVNDRFLHRNLDQPIRASHDTGLLNDLPHHRHRRLLARFDNPARQAPPSIIGAPAEQHLRPALGLSNHHRSHPRQQQELVADVLAELEDVGRGRHPRMLQNHIIAVPIDLPLTRDGLSR